MRSHLWSFVWKWLQPQSWLLKLLRQWCHSLNIDRWNDLAWKEIVGRASLVIRVPVFWNMRVKYIYVCFQKVFLIWNSNIVHYFTLSCSNIKLVENPSLDIKNTMSYHSLFRHQPVLYALCHLNNSYYIHWETVGKCFYLWW